MAGDSAGQPGPGSTGSLGARLRLSGRRVRAWRPTRPNLTGLLRSLLTSYVALGTTLYIVPGRQSSGPLAVLGLVLVVAVVGFVLRPLLAGLAVVFGSFGVLLVGVLCQAVILDVAISLAPDVDVGSHPEVLVVSWVAAAVAAVVNWLFDAGSEDAFLAQLLGRAVRVAHRQARVDGPAAAAAPRGLLIIQWDGVGEQVLRQAITAGQVPTLSSWLRAGTHRLRGWHTGLPATTPAGQAVLLHGDVAEVPSFRWFEKEAGRLMVANRPNDAAEMERRMSTGHGLLAGGGVSVSNLFSGDADTRLLTMSDARLPSRATRGLASFATARGGLLHSVVLFVGEMITELYQGRRQRRRDVQPRIRRGGVFAVQRAVTTALLRDLSVAIVAEQIARGAPVVYVNFPDYDEVAHHAGPSRPEAMRTIDGLDRVAQFFDEVIRETGHRYDIAVLSDHGQSQGATFTQQCGRTLHAVVEELACGASTGAADGEPVVEVLGPDTEPAERWGSANVLLTGVARSDGVAARAVGRTGPAGPGGEIALGRPRAELPVTRGPAGSSGLVVAAAGSLAHVYLAEVPGRVERAEIDRRLPGLIPGLAGHRQIGAVLVRAAGDLIVLGSAGWRMLGERGTAGGSGVDPLADYGPAAAADLYQLDSRRHVGDLVLLGRLDPRTGEVTAFEELVGSHGGLGGGQTGAVFVHPAAWPVPEDPLHGLDVHAVLTRYTAGRDQPAFA